MKKYNKYALQICVFLLIVSGIFNISFITSIYDAKKQYVERTFNEHTFCILCVRACCYGYAN